MPTWQEVAKVAAAQRAEAQEFLAAEWRPAEEKMRRRLEQERQAAAALPFDHPQRWAYAQPVNARWLRDAMCRNHPDLDAQYTAHCRNNTDLDHPSRFQGHDLGFGEGERGRSLETAHRLSQIDAERESLSAQDITRASDDRRRTARLRALESESEQLAAQLETQTSSWWPNTTATGRTAARTAARPGVNVPGPAPRAFLPR